MKTNLKAYFPLIRERTEILAEIRNDPRLCEQFNKWFPQYQEEFLDFCTGVKGVKLLYDAFFKEIMNPEADPDPLGDFLSLVLGRQVSIHSVLPGDSTRIADEGSLLITDIVVRLEDGSLANVEVQKIGYLFPGERSACYSADLLLRQYRRVRGERRQAFRYTDIRSVYTIVLFEKSPKVFRTFPEAYLHRFEQRSDTGLSLELLQKYIFLPLDIFQRTMHNKPVDNAMDAWLMFLSTDRPEQIIQLIEAYPKFRGLYEIVYRICRNMEQVMGIFSEELLQLDRNTVRYMMDEQQETIERLKEQVRQQDMALEQQASALQQRDMALEQQASALRQRDMALEQQKKKQDLFLIRLIKAQAAKGASAEECVSLLALEPELVRSVFEALQKAPDADEMTLYERLTK